VLHKSRGCAHAMSIRAFEVRRYSGGFFRAAARLSEVHKGQGQGKNKKKKNKSKDKKDGGA
jgi:hypothetical protein